MGETGNGFIETVSGGGRRVRYVPDLSGQGARELVLELAATLAEEKRYLPGGFLYLTDLLFTPPALMERVGRVFAARFRSLEPSGS